MKNSVFVTNKQKNSNRKKTIEYFVFLKVKVNVKNKYSSDRDEASLRESFEKKTQLIIKIPKIKLNELFEGRSNEERKQKQKQKIKFKNG